MRLRHGRTVRQYGPVEQPEVTPPQPQISLPPSVPQPEIVEDGLRLRPWRATDADDVHRAWQDPEFQRWTGMPTPCPPERARTFVTERAPQWWAAGTAAGFAVCDASTGALLGSCGLVTIDRVLRSAEVGFWTAPWGRRQGVAVRATRALSRWAFAALGLRRLVWQAALGNHASRVVALRVGFRIEGRLRLCEPDPTGSREGWVGSLFPGEVRDAAEPTAPPGPGWPGSLEARRAAVFSRPQPVLAATGGDGTALRLRPLAERDVDGIVTACADPDSVRWTSVPDPYQRTHAEYFVHEYAPTRWAGGTAALFAITADDDRYVGVIELRLSAADPLVGDLGFLVTPHARGRGFCPAGLVAVCRWGFTALDLTRIEWRANVGNTASRRAAEKAGFVLEGTARRAVNHRGVPTDAWVGALVPEDLGLTGPTDPADAVPTPVPEASASAPGTPVPEAAAPVPAGQRNGVRA